MNPATAVNDDRSALLVRLMPPRNPLAMPFSALSWGAVAYCATGIVTGFIALAAGVLGVLVLPWVAWASAAVEGHRLRLLGLPRGGPVPHRPPRHPWDVRSLRQGNLAVWGVSVVFAVVDVLPGGFLLLYLYYLAFDSVDALSSGRWSVATLLTLGLFVVVLVAGLYVGWGLAIAQAMITDHLLRPPAELSRRVEELTVSRRELVEVFSVERRRIERDLHDGAQQHLVLSSMQLGEADLALEQGDAAAARRAVAAAQDSMASAMTALRETVRGIHPQILSDRGLVAAVRELAQRQAVPVTVTVAGNRPPDEHRQLAAYYLVSEAFTNAAKHADPSTMRVGLELGDDLVVEVYDDGRGGAQVRPGHGLSGMIERIQAFGGRCWVSSPPGGPTLIRAVLPHVPDDPDGRRRAHAVGRG